MKPIRLDTARRSRPSRQRGMVTAAVMLFLIATVVFALAQMLNVSSGNVIDDQRQGDSTAAFFLAESGLEKAQASLISASLGIVTNATCTGIASLTNPYALGRGTVAITGTSTPASCTGSACTACELTAIGKVGISTRTLTRTVAQTTSNGVFCNGSPTRDCSNTPTVTWQLNLTNTSGVNGVGVFNLAYQQQGNNDATCPPANPLSIPPWPGCRLQLDVKFGNNGVSSISLMGNTVSIPAGATYPIYQTMSKGSNELAEVGAFFLGTTAPTLTGPTAAPGAASYWSSTTKAGSIATIGSTNDGTLTSTGTCSAPSASAQTCTSWCYGGDTLVFSVASLVTALTDEIGTVIFGTNASIGNVPMTQVAKFPTPTIVGAPINVDAEIWYARNPNFTPASAPLAVNASSYKGRGTGAVGAAWTTTSASETSITTSGTLGNGTLTIGSTSAFSGTWPAQIIFPGDTITSTSGAVTVTATIGAQSASIETGGMTTGKGGRGSYDVSNVKNNGTLVTTSGTTFNGNPRLWTVNSNVLNVTACTICFFAQTDAIALTGLSAGRTVSAAQTTQVASYGRAETAGGIGRYSISGTATRVVSGTSLYAGTPGSTLYLPASSSQPSVTTPAMRIIVKSGTGLVAPNTTVTAVTAPAGATATTAFTVSATPATALDGASLCGGTCAFFVPGTTIPPTPTTFTLTPKVLVPPVPPGNFKSWNGGFTCLKGVDVIPQVVTSSSTAINRWTEVIN